jgi:hypothetical protein
VFLFKISRADLHAHASGNLANRRQQGQSAGLVTHGFIGNADDFGTEKFLRQLGQRSEMEISEENKPLAEKLVLRLDRFLDLDDQLGLAPHMAGLANNLGTSVLVLGVGEA